MRYINPRYLLTYLLTLANANVTLCGSVFHCWAAVTGKVRSPMVERRVPRRTTSVDDKTETPTGLEKQMTGGIPQRGTAVWCNRSHF